VAAVVSTARSSYLAVLPVNGGRTRFVNVGTPVRGGGPVWSGDGRSIFLAQYPASGETPRVKVISLPDDPQLALHSETLPARIDWEEINGMLMSPSSPYLYLVVTNERFGSQATIALRPVSAANGGTLPRGESVGVRVGESYARGQAEPAAPAWLSDGSMGLVLRGGPTERFKTLLMRYDLAQRRLTSLAEVEDQLTEAAWSPDGRWLVYCTESGLWGLDVAAARDNRAGPVWLSPVPVQGMDWR